MILVEQAGRVKSLARALQQTEASLRDKMTQASQLEERFHSQDADLERDVAKVEASLARARALYETHGPAVNRMSSSYELLCHSPLALYEEQAASVERWSSLAHSLTRVAQKLESVHLEVPPRIQQVDDALSQQIKETQDQAAALQRHLCAVEHALNAQRRAHSFLQQQWDAQQQEKLRLSNRAERLRRQLRTAAEQLSMIEEDETGLEMRRDETVSAAHAEQVSLEESLSRLRLSADEADTRRDDAAKEVKELDTEVRA